MIRRLWQSSPELVATSGLMLVGLAGALVGLAVDPTIITGAAAWLKPAKFAVSITIYTLTLAWIFTLIPEWIRTRRAIGWLTAVVMVLEMSIISSQAWRGKSVRSGRPGRKSISNCGAASPCGAGRTSSNGTRATRVRPPGRVAR